jgi:hypothetical protein
MRILLLTDIPPCKNYTAGLVLDQLCRFLPHDSIACFTVAVPKLNATLSPDLHWMPIRYANRPYETTAMFSRHSRIFHTLVNLALYSYNAPNTTRIASEVVKFGREFGADTLWCPLQGPTQIRLAVSVSTRLGIPLLTQVYDPPEWILRGQSTPKMLQSIMLKNFGTAIKESRACATASWPMAEQYQKDYVTRTVAFLPSLDSRMALPPTKEPHSGNELVIGMAGQMYAGEEWKALISALDAVAWKIAGRKVRIRLLGRWVSFNINGPLRIEYLGWQTQGNTIRLLSESDILYCPYGFSKSFESVARMSFPSKLTTYLAAGRPVLFHGPEYASPWEFLSSNDAGLGCHSNEQSDIIEALETLAGDAGLYSRLTLNGRIAFDEYLTLSCLRRSFATFLGVEDDFLVPDQ